ncbi:Dyp-type peroxidase [Denitrificimonas sp. JX-1]|uniref:Dyp-type peroxidase n=1 Tax=Denitrificimonas halotolerans TaxID=3098930 RepID=A0ABU5GP63_9GAMM|nr:Dyp-type peroxidase [Denitrificimonas sp. JX-1]MDY7218654.1 Dyp-type peroxidase [Denitrificimonas sp. JX-1]
MNKYQTAILAEPVPPLARHVFFTLESNEQLAAALRRLSELADGKNIVVGLGSSLLQAVGMRLDKLRIFPALSAHGIDIPSTQYAMWCWLLGDDRGELLHRTNTLINALAPALSVVQVTESFRYLDGHDLTGYEDGTENPVGQAAIDAAFDTQAPGGSYAAVQHWVHDLVSFKHLPQQEQDHIFGRRLSDNEEIDDAPESAHVKRTAMEDFEPEAFVVRRSMPYIDGDDAGLVFLSFGDTLDSYEKQLRRMIGLDDGITDALFRFSRPVTGGYYWCPPMVDGQLDLSAVL